MTGLLVLGGIFVLYALLASRLEHASVSAPMVFIAAGLVLGPSMMDLLHVQIEQHLILQITELTLGVLLFADAATIRLRELRADPALAGRLLGIGLPLTILVGALVAYALDPSIGWAGAALVASMLAATDTALVIAVVSLPVVPARIRRAINVESGLNDGICTPFFTLFLAATISVEGLKAGSWAAHAAAEIALALVAGVMVGGLGGLLLSAARRRGWTSDASEELAALALALLAYGGSVAIGGNGFVGAFVGGIAFGASTPAGERRAVHFVEDGALFSSFLVWTVFGAVFVGPVLTGPFVATAVVYALLSLTVVRMIPVGIALIGSRLRPATVLFVGWFGPRGLASVVFTLLALESLTGAGTEGTRILQVATWTILLSVFLQGLTGRPLSNRFGRTVATWGPDVAEALAVPDAPTRRRTL
jgi:NhaP-type Na+/H+ or K+/H+ antiporter